MSNAILVHTHKNLTYLNNVDHCDRTIITRFNFKEFKQLKKNFSTTRTNLYIACKIFKKLIIKKITRI